MLRSSKIRGRKGLSNLVAYVLLIAITISLSVVVYGWLKSYVADDSVAVCSDNVNIVLSSYECFSGADGTLNVTLKNKGFFTVDGYVLRVHNRTDADFGFYVLNATGSVIAPGDSVSGIYDISNFGLVTLVDVQPFVMEGGKVNCESYASQKVSCS